ncbi:3-methyl-2-oxobutanoate hydroxymethyltransferase [Cryptococcus depauperatus]|nr:3-methyl-2-oxobutanoate hydroxymethyltransferase [Cryptococcus depauperatus CBS 7855]
MISNVKRIFQSKRCLLSQSSCSTSAIYKSSRSVATSSRIIGGPSHPEIDDSYKQFITSGDMGMGVSLKGNGDFRIQRDTLDQVGPISGQLNRQKAEIDDFSVFASFQNEELIIDKPPAESREKDRAGYNGIDRDERRSPAALLGSKRIGMVVLPEEMQKGIQQQIELLDNPRELRKSYLALPNTFSVAQGKPERREGRSPEMEVAKASAILPGEYGVVKNVLKELEKRLGREWLDDVSKGGILEISSSLGSGLWAVLDVFGLLPSSRIHWKEGQVPLKYFLVHPSKEGLGLIRKITEVALKGLTDIRFGRKLPNDATPSMILSTFHLTSIPSVSAQQLHLRQLLSMSSQYVILIERSTPQGWAAISQARSFFLSKSNNEEPLHIVAPCPHDGACPLVGTKDVCGFSQRLQRPTFLRKTKHSTRGEEEKGYCYLVIAKGARPTIELFGTTDVEISRTEDLIAAGRMGKVGREAAEKALFKSQERSTIQEVEGPEKILEVIHLHGSQSDSSLEEALLQVDKKVLENSLKREAYSWPRLVAPPMKRKGHVTMDACCSDGNIQRITFAKSHSKQGYHDARKSSWGDIIPHTPKSKPIVRTRGVRRLIKNRNEGNEDEILREIMAASLEEEMDSQTIINQSDDLKELELMGIEIPQAQIGKEKGIERNDVTTWSSSKESPFSTGQRRELSTRTFIKRTSSCSSQLMAFQTRYMSARPKAPVKSKTTLSSLLSLAKSNTPISVLTAYDYPTALLSEICDVDMTLVGDSLSQVALGYESTTSITLDEMIHHARAVRRGAKTPFVFVDMPFGSFESSVDQGVKNVVRMIKEGGIDGVKIEGGLEIVPLVKRLSSVGIPVMPHLGLRPQRATALSGYIVQGRTAIAAYEILQTARALADAGAFAFLLEALPEKVASIITGEMIEKGVFTIGIGAGKWTNGQVLVITDLLGFYPDDSTAEETLPIIAGDIQSSSTPRDLAKPLHAPRFVRQFVSVGQEMRRGVREYVQAVKEKSFPDEKETYGMKKEQWVEFLRLIEQEKGQN